MIVQNKFAVAQVIQPRDQQYSVEVLTIFEDVCNEVLRSIRMNFAMLDELTILFQSLDFIFNRDEVRVILYSWDEFPEFNLDSAYII